MTVYFAAFRPTLRQCESTAVSHLGQSSGLLRHACTGRVQPISDTRFVVSNNVSGCVLIHACLLQLAYSRLLARVKDMLRTETKSSLELPKSLPEGVTSLSESALITTFQQVALPRFLSQPPHDPDQ